MLKFTSLTLLLLIAFAVSSNAQQMVSYVKSNYSRLNIDFEVKDNAKPDRQMLSSINLDNYEQLRKINKRVVITDITTGYILILYSQKETDKNRANQSPLQMKQSAEYTFNKVNN
jgi:hypothetical protein